MLDCLVIRRRILAVHVRGQDRRVARESREMPDIEVAMVCLVWRARLGSQEFLVLMVRLDQMAHLGSPFLATVVNMAYLDWTETLVYLGSQVCLVQEEIVERRGTAWLVHRVLRVDRAKMELLPCLDPVVKLVIRVSKVVLDSSEGYSSWKDFQDFLVHRVTSVMLERLEMMHQMDPKASLVQTVGGVLQLILE